MSFEVVLVAQSCLTLCRPMDCSPPGSSIHGILQARVLEWVAIPSSRGSFQLRAQTQVSCIAGSFFTIWVPGHRWLTTPISHIDYTNAFDCVDHSKLWKIVQEIGIPDHITCLLRSLEQVKQQLELDMKQWTGSKLGKDYCKAVYCHPAYLTYMQSAKCWAGWSTSWNQDCQERYQ